MSLKMQARVDELERRLDLLEALFANEQGKNGAAAEIRNQESLARAGVSDKDYTRELEARVTQHSNEIRMLKARMARRIYGASGGGGEEEQSQQVPAPATG